MERLKIAKDILKMAADLMLADSDYIYDPDHEKHPGGGYHKTEKGWSKLEEKKENGSHKKPVVDDSKSDEIPSLDDTRPMTEKEQWRYEQAFNGDWEMRVDYAEHESHPKILDKMSGDRNLSVVWEVAKNNHTHPSTLEKLSNSPESHIRKSVAENQNTHIKTLEKLSKDSDEGVSKAAKESISNRKKEKLEHSKPSSRPSNPYPASNAFDTARVTTNPKQLEKLSKHEHYRIRENVANNPNTPENVLRNLGSDEAFQVRAQVAGNPKTPEDVLEKLSNEKESYILGNLSNNPSATPKMLKNVAINTTETYILQDLSKYPDMQVRMEVAHNPKTDKDTLDKLADDKERQVKWDVAENLNTSTETLDKIANGTNDSDILEGVAGNPNTSTETLKKLSNHEHHYVSKAAKENLAKREQSQSEVKFDISKLSPEMREKVKDWDAEDIAKFIGWLKEHKGK